jgi:hypothetical protein
MGARLAHHLPEGLIAPALDVARAINDERKLEDAVAPMAVRLAALSDSGQFAAWARALHAFASGVGSRLLRAVAVLAPAIPEPVDSGRLSRVIGDVHEWWP